jgi:hypothetical protein
MILLLRSGLLLFRGLESDRQENRLGCRRRDFPAEFVRGCDVGYDDIVFARFQRAVEPRGILNALEPVARF